MYRARSPHHAQSSLLIAASASFRESLETSQKLRQIESLFEGMGLPNTIFSTFLLEASQYDSLFTYFGVALVVLMVVGALGFSFWNMSFRPGACLFMSMVFNQVCVFALVSAFGFPGYLHAIVGAVQFNSITSLQCLIWLSMSMECAVAFSQAFLAVSADSSDPASRGAKSERLRRVYKFISPPVLQICFSVVLVFAIIILTTRFEFIRSHFCLISILYVSSTILNVFVILPVLFGLFYSTEDLSPSTSTSTFKIAAKMVLSESGGANLANSCHRQRAQNSLPPLALYSAPSLHSLSTIQEQEEDASSMLQRNRYLSNSCTPARSASALQDPACIPHYSTPLPPSPVSPNSRFVFPPPNGTSQRRENAANDA